MSVSSHTAPPSPCVDEVALGALLRGEPNDGPGKDALAHVRGCERCRDRLFQGVVGSVTAEGPLSSAAPPTTRTPLQPGTIIAGRYRVDGMRGAGGMGMVFEGTQLDLGRRVAIKVLLPEHASDPLALARFQREARLASLLVNEHTVTIYDLGRLDTGQPFLVMELLDGEDLGAVIDRGPLPVNVALEWTLAVCDAMSEAHALGIVHRDLKPENLFLVGARGGSARRIKVLDFGLAKLRSGREPQLEATSLGMAVGSPLTMAPEQIGAARDADARADVWALGVTFYMLVTGGPPFDGADIHELFGKIRHAKAPSLRPVTGPAIAEVVERCLAKDPAGRPRDASELRAELLRAKDAPHPSGGSLTATLDKALGAVPRTEIMAPVPPRGAAPPARPVAVRDPMPVARPAALPRPSPSRVGLVLGAAALILSIVVAVVLVVLRLARGNEGVPTPPVSRALRPPTTATPTVDLDEAWTAKPLARLRGAGWLPMGKTATPIPDCLMTNYPLVKDGQPASATFFTCEDNATFAPPATSATDSPASVCVADAPNVLCCGAPTRATAESICATAHPL